MKKPKTETFAMRCTPEEKQMLLRLRGQIERTEKRAVSMGEIVRIALAVYAEHRKSST